MKLLLLSDDKNVERVVKIAAAIKGIETQSAHEPMDGYDIVVVDESHFDRLTEWKPDTKNVIYLYKNAKSFKGDREGFDLKKPFLPKDLIRLFDVLHQDEELLVRRDMLERGGVLDEREVQNIQKLLEDTPVSQSDKPMRLQDIVSTNEMNALKSSLAQMSFELDEEHESEHKQIDIVLDAGGKRDINITITINVTLQGGEDRNNV